MGMLTFCAGFYAGMFVMAVLALAKRSENREIKRGKI